MQATETSQSLAISDAADSAPLTESLLTASEPYVGQWNRLVSTTNWQKGRIIGAWRESLVAQAAGTNAIITKALAPAEFSDEAWARLVGGVTGQHVGRLRRVFARFGQVHEQYAGLFWSHFQAALDWNDAEMWLEGAVASGWSVARMRDERWRTLGQLESDRPQAGDLVASETDEDFEPAPARDPIPHAIAGQYDEVQHDGLPGGPRVEGPDFGDERTAGNGARGYHDDAADAIAGLNAAELVRPFENLPDLPDDLAEAVESLKLAILRHKSNAWSEIGLGDVLRVLDGLKALATAPSGEAPF